MLLFPKHLSMKRRAQGQEQEPEQEQVQTQQVSIYPHGRLRRLHAHLMLC
jgi:hypothetical protein